MGRLRSRVSALVCVGLVTTTAVANESTVYTYDALGRLIATSITGGPGNGRQVSTGFDPADNRSNYTVSGAPTANFSIADATVTEGGTAAVIVTRTGSSAAAATVGYATSNGSAVAPADYTAASGTLSFAAGEGSKTIPIVTINDSIYEGTKSFAVTLSSPTGGVGIADANAAVTITDDEVVPQLAISNATVTEGGTATLTVTRSSATGPAVSVNYASADGSAVAPADYGAVSSTLSFASGETSKTITVNTVNDTAYEGTEGFTVGLSGATGGAIITTATGQVSVTDNDVAPSFAISSASAAEGSSIVMTVTKTGSTNKTLTVNYATANGSASAPADYGQLTGVLTFLPAETSKTVTITTVNDTVYESAETFTVSLSGASGGALISTARGTGTITDNDTAPVLSVANVSVMEGDYANVTVTKTGATGLNSSVSFATADGTATSGGSMADRKYISSSGTLLFRPGEMSKVVQVKTIQDNLFSLPKTFTLTLSAPSGATLGSSTGTVSILNNNPPPSLSILDAVPQVEGTSLKFSIGVSAAFDAPITVNYTTSSGTATSGVDFTPTSGTLLISSGQIVVPVIQDSDGEADETLYVTLSSPSHGATIDRAQAVGVIKNDDIPPSTGPVANPDNGGSHARCDEFTINPVANDTDPGGNYPLTLVSVATGVGYTRTISGNNVTFFAQAGGTRNILYVVANSIGGQATGTITYTVASGPACTGGQVNALPID